MKKDVLISITGIHYGDWNQEEESEPVEIITPASYYLKNGKHYIIYDEVMEGVPGSVRNTIKIDGDALFEISKSGSASTRMVFEKDKINMANYQTPYGEILVGIHTRDIRVEVQEEQIDVNISYELDVNEEPLSDCEIRVNIRNVGQPEPAALSAEV